MDGVIELKVIITLLSVCILNCIIFVLYDKLSFVPYSFLKMCFNKTNNVWNCILTCYVSMSDDIRDISSCRVGLGSLDFTPSHNGCCVSSWRAYQLAATWNTASSPTSNSRRGGSFWKGLVNCWVLPLCSTTVWFTFFCNILVLFFYYFSIFALK